METTTQARREKVIYYVSTAKLGYIKMGGVVCRGERKTDIEVLSGTQGNVNVDVQEVDAANVDKKMANADKGEVGSPAVDRRNFWRRGEKG
jgi:hypothetical protein